MRVLASLGVCISSGNCVMTAPNYFDQDDDGIVVVLRADAPDADVILVREAADRCPVGAIEIVVGDHDAS